MIEQILMEMDAGPIKLWDIQRLGGGLSNQNYLLCHQKSHEKFVLKMPPQSTDTVIRMQEIEVYQQCARLGLSPELVAWSQEKAMLSRYVEADVLTPQMLNELPGVFEQCIGLIQTFHRAVKVDFSMSFDKIMYLFPDFDAEYMFGRIADYHIMIQVVTEIAALIISLESDQKACHNDLILNNILVDRHQKCWLIDFEWSGLNNVFYDLSKLCIFSALDENKIIKAYFGMVDEDKTAKMYLFKMINHYLVAQWCSTQLQESQLDVHKELYNIGKRQLNLFLKAYRHPKFKDAWGRLV